MTQIERMFGDDDSENARLRTLNAELVKALKAMVYHFGVLEDNDMVHPVARSASKKARAVLAKARLPANRSGENG